MHAAPPPKPPAHINDPDVRVAACAVHSVLWGTAAARASEVVGGTERSPVNHVPGAAWSKARHHHARSDSGEHYGRSEASGGTFRDGGRVGAAVFGGCGEAQVGRGEAQRRCQCCWICCGGCCSQDGETGQ